jgi:Flp pilus assembly pilin Flp
MKNVLANFFKNEKGLVTIEWVGIAAVVVLGAVLITKGIMGSASGLAGQVMTNIDTSCTSAGGTATQCGTGTSG